MKNVIKKESNKKAVKVVKEEDAKEKQYSETEYKTAIETAARHAASEAVDHIRAVDEERENDKKVLEGDIKSGDKKKTKKDPATEIKKSVKSAVIKAAAEDAKNDGTTGLGKKTHGIDIITSMSGIHGDPTGSGLNAAAAAGVDMAKQILEKTSGSNPSWFAGTKMAPGISASG